MHQIELPARRVEFIGEDRARVVDVATQTEVTVRSVPTAEDRAEALRLAELELDKTLATTALLQEALR